MIPHILLGLLLSGPGVEVAATPPARTCLNAVETRQAVEMHKLADPGAALRSAAAHARAEPLRTRLCRWNDDFIYEITLLRRDGKVMHVNVRALDGEIVVSPGEP